MTTSSETAQDREFSHKAVEASSRIGLVLILAVYCCQFGVCVRKVRLRRDVYCTTLDP